MDKINSFFGYNYINKINLKIIQKKIEEKKKSFLKIKNLTRIEEKINGVKNDQLKKSLNDLLKAYNNKYE